VQGSSSLFVDEGGQEVELGGQVVDERGVLVTKEGGQMGERLVGVEERAREGVKDLKKEGKEGKRSD
jgi:hypothetical protein